LISFLSARYFLMHVIMRFFSCIINLSGVLCGSYPGPVLTTVLKVFWNKAESSRCKSKFFACSKMIWSSSYLNFSAWFPVIEIGNYLKYGFPSDFALSLNPDVSPTKSIFLNELTYGYLPAVRAWTLKTLWNLLLLSILSLLYICVFLDCWFFCFMFVLFTTVFNQSS
jgi:hypothetical protein